jgi:hypothetical protein
MSVENYRGFQVGKPVAPATWLNIKDNERATHPWAVKRVWAR